MSEKVIISSTGERLQKSFTHLNPTIIQNQNMFIQMEFLFKYFF